jgi:hypothetical protein
MRVRYKFFRGSLATWDDLFTKAARFASEVGPALLINISHAVAGADGTVTVWYWEENDETDGTEEPPPPIA